MIIPEAKKQPGIDEVHKSEASVPESQPPQYPEEPEEITSPEMFQVDDLKEGLAIRLSSKVFNVSQLGSVALSFRDLWNKAKSNNQKGGYLG